MKVAGVGLVLVIWRGRVAVVPSWTVPKSSERGERVRVEGVALPRRLMKSSAVLESEVISRALMRVAGGVGLRGEGDDEEAACGGEDGGAVALDGEVGGGLEGGDVDGDGAGVGEGDGLGLEALPTWVVAKVRELCEAV